MTKKTLHNPLPDGPLLAYVGDDFTGSTDAMEAFTAAGVSTVLFLRLPSPQWLKRFAHMRCIGLATTARSQSPEWMETHLAPALSAMKSFGAPLLHYKICSTFDSSPQIGSIGKAIELGTSIMPAAWSPTIVGAPRLKRYVAFGNLFAISEGRGYRLDRHPTMSRHPVTPMREADLSLHLAQQTSKRIYSVDFIEMKAGEGDSRLQMLMATDKPVVLLDVLDEETLAEAGRMVWENRQNGLFSASSSGLQYALAAHWRKSGLLPFRAGLAPAKPARIIAVISGSCSPATATQITHAKDNAFLTFRLDIEATLNEQNQNLEVKRIVEAAVQAIKCGNSPLIYSALGPDDPSVIGFEKLARAKGLSRTDAASRIGVALGLVLRGIVEAKPNLQRYVIAGGDSSGAVAKALDITALSIVAGLSPGAPLCRIWSENAAMDGKEIVLKGGQMGTEDFFVKALKGA
jgi:3-oxoisoapionate kinase